MVILIMRRSINRHDKLDLLGLSDINRLVERAFLATGWSCDEDFIPELFLMSGGFPNLVQAIGKSAWECIKDDVKAEKLTVQNIRHAVYYRNDVAASILGTILAGDIDPAKLRK